MATDEERLLLRVEASLRGYERTMARMQRQTKRSTDTVERRFDQMNRRIGRQFQSMSRMAVGALGAIGVGVGAAQLSQLVRDSLDAAESIQDMGRRAGVSAEFLQIMRLAADQNGASARDFDDAISRLNRRLGLFIQSGGGPAAQAFQQLGLETDITSGKLLNAEDVFHASVRALNDVETAAERSALASQLFGEDSGPRLTQMLALGTQGLTEFSDAAREAGHVIEDSLIQRAAEANAEMRRMREELRARTTVAVAENADEIERLSRGLHDVKVGAIEATAALARFFMRASGPVEPGAIRDEIERISLEIERLNGRGGNASQRRDNLIEQLRFLHNRLDRIQADMNSDIVVPGPARETWERWNTRNRTRPGESGSGGSDDPNAAPPLPAPITVGRRGDGFRSPMPSESGLPMREIQAEADAAAVAKVEAYERELQGRRQHIADSMAAGVMAAFDGNLEDFISRTLLQAAFNGLSDAFNQLLGGMNDKKGGGLGGIISTAASAIFGGGKKAPAFGGAKASGGPVNPGRAYRVGELGPETFVPSTAGMIRPANIGSRSRQGDIHVHNDFHLHAEGAVMTDELLRAMDQKALAAGKGAVQAVEKRQAMRQRMSF